MSNWKPWSLSDSCLIALPFPNGWLSTAHCFHNWHKQHWASEESSVSDRRHRKYMAHPLRPMATVMSLYLPELRSLHCAHRPIDLLLLLFAILLSLIENRSSTMTLKLLRSESILFPCPACCFPWHCDRLCWLPEKKRSHFSVSINWMYYRAKIQCSFPTGCIFFFFPNCVCCLHESCHAAPSQHW